MIVPKLYKKEFNPTLAQLPTAVQIVLSEMEHKNISSTFWQRNKATITFYGPLVPTRTLLRLCFYELENVIFINMNVNFYVTSDEQRDYLMASELCRAYTGN